MAQEASRSGLYGLGAPAARVCEAVVWSLPAFTLPFSKMPSTSSLLARSAQVQPSVGPAVEDRQIMALIANHQPARSCGLALGFWDSAKPAYRGLANRLGMASVMGPLERNRSSARRPALVEVPLAWRRLEVLRDELSP